MKVNLDLTISCASVVTWACQGLNNSASASCCTPTSALWNWVTSGSSVYLFAYNTILPCYKQVEWGSPLTALCWGSVFELLVNPVLSFPFFFFFYIFLVLKIYVWTNKKAKERKRNTYFLARREVFKKCSEIFKNCEAVTVFFPLLILILPIVWELLRCYYSCNITERYSIDATWKVV